MSWTIILRDKHETEVTISDEEYDKISGILDKLRLVKLSSGFTFNTVDVKAIKPSGQRVVPGMLRIEAPKFEKVDCLDSFISTFDFLKSRGLFVEFKDYNDWLARRDKVKPGSKIPGGKVFLDGKIL